MSRAMRIRIALAWPFLSGVSAQLPLCLSGYTPLYNSLNQTPCQMATALGGACNNGVYSIGPLAPGTFYLGPPQFGGNTCLCNTVYYSLLSACAYCQGHSYYDWSTFNVNCSITYNQVFMEPIPSSTRIPHYAYLDVEAGNTFNVAAALSAGGLESTPVLRATGSSTTTSSTTSSSTPSPTPTPTPSPTPSPTPTPIPVGRDSTLTAWEISVVVVAVVVFLGIVTVCIIVLRRLGGVAGIRLRAGKDINVRQEQSGSGQLVVSTRMQ